MRTVLILLVFLLMYQTGFTQKNEDPIIVRRERDFRPSFVRMSYDIIPLGITAFSGKKSGQGFQAMVDFDQFFLAGEFGFQKTERGESYRYRNQGNYFSIGAEVNMLKPNPAGNALTFGLRYGSASFNDELNFNRDSTFFGNQQIMDANPDMKAKWMELTLSLSTNVWEGLYMGYTVRYKVFRNVDGIGSMAPYDVPGFGLYEDNTGVQFNYYIGWTFRFREKYPEQLPEE